MQIGSPTASSASSNTRSARAMGFNFALGFVVFVVEEDDEEDKPPPFRFSLLKCSTRTVSSSSLLPIGLSPARAQAFRSPAGLRVVGLSPSAVVADVIAGGQLDTVLRSRLLVMSPKMNTEAAVAEAAAVEEVLDVGNLRWSVASIEGLPVSGSRDAFKGALRKSRTAAALAADSDIDIKSEFESSAAAALFLTLVLQREPTQRNLV